MLIGVTVMDDSNQKAGEHTESLFDQIVEGMLAFVAAYDDFDEATVANLRKLADGGRLAKERHLMEAIKHSHGIGVNETP